MVQKGVFGLLSNAHVLVYYPIISYQRIEVYRVETIYMRRLRWNNGVRGILNPSKYGGIYCTG